jgi:hypothetical protein
MARGELIVRGDAAASVIDMLHSAPEISSLAPAVKVMGDLVGFSTGERRIVVQQKGASPTYSVVVSRPRIDLWSYAENRNMAHDLADLAWAILRAERGNYVGNGLLLVDVNEFVGMTWQPDAHTGAPCFLQSLQLRTRPHG